MTESDPGVYDHLRTGEGGPVPPGVYRVVGTGERVVLLRVADADGRRTTTGVVESVGRDALEAFDPAENPDQGFGFGLSDLLDRVTRWRRRSGTGLASSRVRSARRSGWVRRGC
jgi:hypothetical protein